MLGDKFARWRVDLAPVCRTPDGGGSCPNCFAHDQPNDPARAPGKQPGAWWDNESCRQPDFHLPDLGLSSGLTVENLNSRASLLSELDRARRTLGTDPAVDRMDTYRRQAWDLILGQTGKHVEAIAYLRKAEVLAPDYPSVHSNLGAELAATGKGREAAAEIQKALDLKPDLAEAHTTLGGLLAGQGRYREALPHLLKAVESQPGNPVAQRNLALALADMGKPAEAIPHEEQAIKIGGPDPVMFNFLGQLYARAGRLAEAASVFRQALQMATQEGDRQLVRDLQSQLAALGAQ
jgi:Flp pilus assembly protein TadD